MPAQAMASESAATAIGGDQTASLDRSPEAARLIARFEHIPFSAWHRRARIVMGSATFLDAFDALSLAFAMPILVGLWHLTPVNVGWLIGASYIGQLVGALFFSRLAESRGRIPSAGIATAIMSVMGIVCIFAGSLQWLFVCRLVQGIGVGGEMPVAAAYISELSRAHGRGRFFILYELLFPIGLMATGQIATLLVPAFGWETLFLVGAVPGLIVTVALWRLPESPRWLINRGRLDEARTIIEQAEASAARRFPTFEPLKGAAVPASAMAPTGDMAETRWRELLSPVYRARTLIAWLLWASAFFVANGLNNWMPTLYHTVYSLPLRDALRAASLTNVAQVAVLLVCAFCIDRIGRRNWTTGFFILSTVLLVALAFSGATSVAVVIVMATLAYGAVASNNAVLYLYTPEIYPTRLRAIGTGLATSWLRIASAVAPTLVGMIMAQGGVRWVFAMFAIVAAIGAVAALGMIETRGRRLEEIAQ
ncbi:MAG: MFS transporter [Rhizobiales bacterium]|nr:MFS transporter [Hyphomicrobiales bacterium]